MNNGILKITKLLIKVFSLILMGGLFYDSAWAHPAFREMFIFGTSISDPGNFYILEKDPTNFCASLDPPKSIPPYANLDPLRIPDRPYAVGHNHFTNGPTWIERYARMIGLGRSAAAAYSNHRRGAHNYAVGGARATDIACRIDLPQQIEAFTAHFGNGAPDDALYVLEFGSNDVRDAMEAYGKAGGLAASKIIINAVQGIELATEKLYGMGARNFLIVLAPDISKTWAIRTADMIQPGTMQLAQTLALNFNIALRQQVVAGLQAKLGLESVKVLDVFTLLDEIYANPESFGLGNATDTCVTPSVSPYQCEDPDSYLFWDGIHPTKAAYGVFADQTASLFDVKHHHGHRH